MITKLNKDHIIKQTPFCGELREILHGPEFSPNIAVVLDILPTVAHYHMGFDEIYFVLDGDIDLCLHDPNSGKTIVQKLSSNELCIINKGVHHKVMRSSPRNRLCVLSVPEFNGNDEYISEAI